MSLELIRNVGVVVVGFNNLSVVARLEGFGYDGEDNLYLAIKEGKKVVVDIDGKQIPEDELNVKLKEAQAYVEGLSAMLNMRD